MDTDSNDLSSLTSLISPVSLQLQKHLLSSTLQGDTDPLQRARQRGGSCSPTPALPYTPTPSPSPFNSSLNDISLTLTADPKSIHYPAGGPGSFDELDLTGVPPRHTRHTGIETDQMPGGQEEVLPKLQPLVDVHTGEGHLDLSPVLSGGRKLAPLGPVSMDPGPVTLQRKLDLDHQHHHHQHHHHQQQQPKLTADVAMDPSLLQRKLHHLGPVSLEPAQLTAKDMSTLCLEQPYRQKMSEIATVRWLFLPIILYIQ